MTTRETVVAAIANAIENNRVSCPQCEGGGRMYADGKPHYYSEGAPTKPCPNCEGTGKVEEQDVEDAIADAVMQLPALQLAEKVEQMNRDDPGPQSEVLPALLNLHVCGGPRYVLALIDTCESVVTRAWGNGHNPDRLETYRAIEVMQ